MFAKHNGRVPRQGGSAAAGSDTPAGGRFFVEIALGVLLGCFLVVFGLSWAALGVSLCFFGVPGASGSDFGAILEPFSLKNP